MPDNTKRIDEIKTQAIGYRDAPDGNVRRAVGPCAFEPVVVHKAGIEAIMEVVRFARIQGLEPPISGKGAEGGNDTFRSCLVVLKTDQRYPDHPHH